MIAGTVAAGYEPMVAVHVRGAAGVTLDVDAQIDTGFTGFLTLPPAAIARLGLSWRSRDRIKLADGRWARFDIYDGVILWDGRPRRVFVDSTDVDPVIGLRLLAGHRLTADFRPGGPVTVEPLP